MAAAAEAAALSLAAACCLPRVEAAARVFPPNPAALESVRAVIQPVGQVMEAGVGAASLVEALSALPLLSNRRRRDHSLAVALGRVAISEVDQAGATAAVVVVATMEAGAVAALPAAEGAATSVIKGAAAAIRM
jgi:hypothetical protein